MIRCGVSFIEFAQQILINSAQGLFHKGQYYACLQKPQMKYSLIELGIGGVDFNMFTAFCLPRQCSDELITSKLDSALKIIGIPFEILYINSHTETYEYPMGWLAYLTILIILLIGGTVAIATIRSQNRRNQNKWLECFNLGKNMGHFKVRQGEDLNCLDGIRSLALLWVIIGHIFSFSLNVGIENITDLLPVTNHPFFLVIEGGLLAVDIFLCLGGFFLAFVMLRHKINGKVCGLGILHRVLRIWPAYILSMMLYYSLFMRAGSGPFWFKAEKEIQPCSTMWRDILFMSNLIENGKSQCMAWGWYLQVDFQLFVIGVLLIYLYAKNKWVFRVVSGMLSVGCLVFNFIWTFSNNMRIFTDIEAFINFQIFMMNLYIKPYARLIPYLMGFVLGIMFMNYRKSIKLDSEVESTKLGRFKVWCRKNNKKRVIFEWIGIALMLFVVFIPRPLQLGTAYSNKEHTWPQWIHSLYFTFSKPIFIGGMIMTFLPSILSIRHSIINTILTARVFFFLARISFCTYLVHLFVIFQFLYSRSYDVYYDIKETFSIFIRLVPIILFLGLVMTLVIEVPFGNMLKMALARDRAKDGKEKMILRQELVAKDDTLKINSSTNASVNEHE